MKNNAYLGIDIGSISTKGVIIDEQNNILAYEYIMTDANPIKASKELVRRLSTKFNYNKYKIVGVGTTGSARRLIGEMLGANIIKNEITAHAVGTITIHPDVSGRPQGILMHRKLIEYMRSKPGVTFVTYAEACEDFLSKK